MRNTCDTVIGTEFASNFIPCEEGAAKPCKYRGGKAKHSLSVFIHPLPLKPFCYYEPPSQDDDYNENSIPSCTRDSKLRGTRRFSSCILIFFQYACRTVRPDFRRLPIGNYIDKRVYSAIIVVIF